MTTNNTSAKTSRKLLDSIIEEIDEFLGTESLIAISNNPEVMLTTMHISEDIQMYIDIYNDSEDDSKEDYTFVSNLFIKTMPYKFEAYDEEHLFELLNECIIRYTTLMN